MARDAEAAARNLLVAVRAEIDDIGVLFEEYVRKFGEVAMSAAFVKIIQATERRRDLTLISSLMPFFQSQLRASEIRLAVLARRPRTS